MNDPAMEALGYFDAYTNSVTVNMGRHFSAREAASTIVREAAHQNGFYKGRPQNTQFSEYQASGIGFGTRLRLCVRGSITRLNRTELVFT